MTGCYRYVGRHCVSTESGTCIHCGCPISERSSFAPPELELETARMRPRWTNDIPRSAIERKWRTFDETNRTEHARSITRLHEHGAADVRRALEETRARKRFPSS